MSVLLVALLEAGGVELGVLLVAVELLLAPGAAPGVLLEALVESVGDVVVAVLDDELAGGVVAVDEGSAGFTSTFELDDAGGVEVSVLVQPTTPTPTARMAARRYDGFIVRFPSFDDG